MAKEKKRQEEFKLFRLSSVDDLEFVKVSNQTHVFPRHWNETYVIQVVEQGVNECYCRGATHRVSTGSILFINPHEIHTGSAVGTKPLWYRSFYPTPELLAEVVTQIGDRQAQLSSFPNFIVPDARLAKMFLRAHRECEAGADSLTAPTLVLDLLSLLLKRHSDSSLPARTMGNEIAAVKRALDFLNDNYNKNVSLDSAAKVAYLSPFHFLRAFRKNVGLPPHEYLINLRIQRAKHLLLQGRPLSDVAYETGFFDQSHFNRHFKRLIGLPPGQFLKKSNIVQNLSPGLQ